jgi:hypothetical protein
VPFNPETSRATRTKGNQPGANLAEVLCFPNEACYRPGMSVAQHQSEKQLWIQQGRDAARYAAHRAANPYPADWPPVTPDNQEVPTRR